MAVPAFNIIAARLVPYGQRLPRGRGSLLRSAGIGGAVVVLPRATPYVFTFSAASAGCFSGTKRNEAQLT
jgi:hypothetical protein